MLSFQPSGRRALQVSRALSTTPFVRAPQRSIRTATSHGQIRQTSNMATPYKLQIVPEETGFWKVKQTEASAKKVTELLQEDLKTHHVFFNNMGFHNHIVHHILALYGTGAEAKHLQKGYDGNTSYQRHAMSPHDGVPEQMKDYSQMKKYLGKGQHYADFLAFWQAEIERSSWQDVLAKYVFAGDERADDILVRLFAGFVHPLIQLMYGVEWDQPAIVAEGLAQACVHKDDIRYFLIESERRANERRKDEKMPPILELYEEVRRNEKLARSIRMSDDNKLTGGVIARAGEEMLAIASKVKVRPEELREKTVEMFNACLYVTASAARHPTKHVKFDFFLIHHVNVAPIFLSFLSMSWIPDAAKARILEFKIRSDLAQYAARGVPPISLDRITTYQPKPKQQPKEQHAKGDNQGALGIVARLHDLDEDGHAIKLGRAAGICQMASEEYEDRDWLPIRGKDTWMKVYHMIVDSVEGPGAHWVRTTGLEEAWRDVVDAPKL